MTASLLDFILDRHLCSCQQCRRGIVFVTILPLSAPVMSDIYRSMFVTQKMSFDVSCGTSPTPSIRSGFLPDHNFGKSRSIPLDRSSLDFICLILLSFNFLLLSWLPFIMSDSILDDILAQAEMLSVTDASPPVSPGVARTPVARVSPRRGGVGYEVRR